MESEEEDVSKDREAAEELSWTLEDGLLFIDPEEDSTRQRGEVAEGLLRTSKDDFFKDFFNADNSSIRINEGPTHLVL